MAAAAAAEEEEVDEVEAWYNETEDMIEQMAAKGDCPITMLSYIICARV
jgi:hypothetical protein